MRKDPPFDLEYVASTWLLSAAEREGARVFNAPDAMRDHNEKFAIAEFPQFTAPSLVVAPHGAICRRSSTSSSDVGAEAARRHGRRPASSACATTTRTATSIVETISVLGTRSVMAQRYIPEIKDGDKRVLLIDGKLVPHCLARIPKAGESRGNLAAGARGVAQPITKRHREIARGAGPGACQTRAAAGRARRDRRLAHRSERHQPDLLPRDPGPDRIRRLRACSWMRWSRKLHDRRPRRHPRQHRRGAAHERGADPRRIAAAGGDAQRVAAGRPGRPGAARARAARRASTPATACWCSPTSSARRPATWCRGCSRTARIEGVSGVSLPMLLRVLTSRNGSLARGGAARALGRRRGRGAHEPATAAAMPSADATIVNKLGLHARAAAKLTHLAGNYQCEIWLSRSGRRVNAKSIMGVMMLAAGQGTSVLIEAEGADAEQAIAALTKLIADKFGEGRMNFVLHGYPVSGGITVGNAHLVSTARLEVAHYEVAPDAVEAEVARFDRAMRTRAGGARRAQGAHPAGLAGRVRGVPRPAPHDPQRLGAGAGAARADPQAARQRRVGAGAADGAPGRALRGDRRPVPARAQGRRAAGGRARARGADGRPDARRAGAVGGGEADRGGARPLARRHDPVQEAPLRRLRHRRRRRHLAHRDRRALARHPGDRRPAPRAPDDQRGRDADRRRHAAAC